MTNYPKPATPLPWLQGTTTDVGYSATIGPCHIWTLIGPGCGLVATTAPWCQPYDAQQVDASYIVHAANAFPHLVAALEIVAGFRERPDPLIGNPELAQCALAIARGVKP